MILFLLNMQQLLKLKLKNSKQISNWMIKQTTG